MPDDVIPEIRTDIPHSARIWNYWMGGKDNYQVDRDAGDACVEVVPGHRRPWPCSPGSSSSARSATWPPRPGSASSSTSAPACRRCRTPTRSPRSVAPDSKIVYVDNDPMVLAHARALLTNTTPEGVTAYIDADYHEPEQIVADARNVLNFSQPIARHVHGRARPRSDYDDMRRIVSTVMDAVPSGSYLTLWDGTTDSQAYVDLCEGYAKTGGVPYVPRPREEIRAVFDGLEMVPPGYVSITQWWADEDDEDLSEARPISAYGAVARKP